MERAPEAGDLVTWSGARDAKGHATGYGTLTWFTPQKVTLIGWNFFRERHYTVSSRVSGTMVHGKFEEASAGAEPKKKERTDISDQRATASSAPARSTVKPEKINYDELLKQMRKGGWAAPPRYDQSAHKLY